MSGELDCLVKSNGNREREPIPANSLACKLLLKSFPTHSLYLVDAQIHAAAAHHQRLRQKRRIKYILLITVVTLVIITIIL